MHKQEDNTKCIYRKAHKNSCKNIMDPQNYIHTLKTYLNGLTINKPC